MKLFRNRMLRFVLAAVMVVSMLPALALPQVTAEEVAEYGAEVLPEMDAVYDAKTGQVTVSDLPHNAARLILAGYEKGEMVFGKVEDDLSFASVVLPVAADADFDTLKVFCLNADSTPVTECSVVYDVLCVVNFVAGVEQVKNFPKEQMLREGECVEKPEDPERNGFAFEGWYADANYIKQYDFSVPVTGDVTLYAKWNDSIFAKPLNEEYVKTAPMNFEGEEFEGQYVANELIVVVDIGTTEKQVEDLAAAYGAAVVGQIPLVGYYQFAFSKGYTPEQLEAIGEQLLKGAFVKDYYLNTVSEYALNGYVPNDLIGEYEETYEAFDEDTYAEFYAGLLWGHEACGVTEAQSLVLNHRDNPTIKLAAMDDSFDIHHEDLNFSYYRWADERFNPDTVAEKYPDCAEHGTHVAGIMGAANNNKKGISGVALNAELDCVALRNSAEETGCLAGIFHEQAGLAELIRAGNKVINYSIGAEWYVAPMTKANAEAIYNQLLLFKALNYEFLIVTAAGNSGEDVHNTNYSNMFANIREAAIKDRIIVVGNARRNGTTYSRSVTSSYRGGRVDVMAPGTGIYSTIPNSKYTKLDGTSMASPFVAGLAGLVWEANPDLTPEEVKEIICRTADIPVADSECNMVNALAAVKEALKRAGVSDEPIEYIYDEVLYSLDPFTEEATLVQAVNHDRESFELPDEITHEGTTYKITAVGDDAFGEWMWGVKILHFPKYVKRIGFMAFYGSDLSAVTLPSGLEYVDSYGLFDGELPDVICFNRPIHMEYNAIRSYTPYDIILGPYFKEEDFYFGEAVIQGVDNITVQNNDNYAVEDDVLYRRESDGYWSLIYYFKDESCREFTVPNEINEGYVTTVASYAFSTFHRQGLDVLTLPQNITRIETDAIDAYINSKHPTFKVYVENYAAEIEKDAIYTANRDRTQLYGFAGSSAYAYASSSTYVRFYELQNTTGVEGMFFYENGNYASEATIDICAVDGLSLFGVPVKTDGMGIFKILLEEGTYEFFATICPVPDDPKYNLYISETVVVKEGEMTDMGNLVFLETD